MVISDIIEYLIKVVIIQAVFFGLYRVLFMNRTIHGLNRIYLLGTLLFSLFIPFMENPFPAESQPLPQVDMIERIAAYYL